MAKATGAKTGKKSGGGSTKKTAPAKAKKAAPQAAAAVAAADDGPCFEFRRVLDQDGNPVLRKFEIPCPEK